MDRGLEGCGFELHQKIAFRQSVDEERPAKSGPFYFRDQVSMVRFVRRQLDSKFNENVLRFFAGKLFDRGDPVAKFF